MKKFEYTVDVVPYGQSTTTTLNAMGQNGWDAIDIHRLSDGSGITAITFKREVVKGAKYNFVVLDIPSGTGIGDTLEPWGDSGWYMVSVISYTGSTRVFMQKVKND